MKKYRMVVVGATGVVGREVLEILAERKLPYSEVVALSSAKNAGNKVPFGKNELLARDLEGFDFAGFDIALFCIPTALAKEYVPQAVAKGCFVIDNSTHYRTDPEVPIIIPELNAELVKQAGNKKIIANSNCAAIQTLMAMKPLHEHARIKRVVIATYQSVSGWGKEAMDELNQQTKSRLEGKGMEIKVLPKQIAFNVIPQIDKFMEDGSTIEEWKIEHDIHKILDKDIKVVATAVRVPVFFGHAVSLNLEFEKAIDDKTARKLLEKFPGIKVVDKREDGGYETPIEAAGQDEVFISRIRKDDTVENGLNLWVVSDNIRKGAALNTVQIAEELIKQKII